MKKSLSIISLIASLIPLATFIEILLKLELSSQTQGIWVFINIVSIIIGFTLSVICVKDKKSRSIVNIIALIICILWLLNMIGIVAVAILTNFS